MPREHWDGQRPDQKPNWHPRFGDRAQQIVFIGQNIDEDEIRANLDACLLDEDLANADHETWAALPNPFPEFESPDEE